MTLQFGSNGIGSALTLPVVLSFVTFVGLSAIGNCPVHAQMPPGQAVTAQSATAQPAEPANPLAGIDVL